MCNRYEVDKRASELAEIYSASLPEDFDWADEINSWRELIAPGLWLNADGEREVVPMQFSLTPPWSKIPKSEYATNNARVEEIETKKSYLQPFQKHHCVLPVTAFTEPCYWGAGEGSEVTFYSNTDEVLHVAGIYSVWKSKDKTTSHITMSFLMCGAAQYIMDTGHHRMPLFIRSDGIDSWLNAGTDDVEVHKNTLRNIAAVPVDAFRHHREMKTWKQRVKKKLATKEKQVEAIKNCPHSCGF